MLVSPARCLGFFEHLSLDQLDDFLKIPIEVVCIGVAGEGVAGFMESIQVELLFLGDAVFFHGQKLSLTTKLTGNFC